MKDILTRRSIRKYTDRQVTDDTVNSLLKAAMSAPSAGNQQPWQFVVIRDRKVLDEITGVHPYASMLKTAPCAILVCGDEKLETHKGFWVQDCSAATQNILVAANSMGLGTVWLGVYPREKRTDGLKKLLNIPDHVIPMSLIAVGFPAEKKDPADRFKKERIHYDRW